ncbi:MAG: hypothetical protein PVF85_04575 [Anaerolineales bacterium]|jgi:hypothetical protein
MIDQEKPPIPCEDCGLRRFAERKPNSLIARIWRWHTSWCPGWEVYQLSLAEAGGEGNEASLQL